MKSGQCGYVTCRLYKSFISVKLFVFNNHCRYDIVDIYHQITPKIKRDNSYKVNRAEKYTINR